MLNLVRRATCYNQGELIQFFILASYLHRDLKDAICEEGDTLSSNIKAKYDDLVDFINLKFAQICSKNFDYLAEYFRQTNRPSPRICLKATHFGEIVDMYRSMETPYLHKYPSDSNTGFKQVVENGHFYLNNNIPVSILKGEYTNPRLIEIEVEKFKNKFCDNTSNEYTKIKHSSNDWCSLWSDREQFESAEAHDLTCYKSTLIVPLTLRNISLSKLFLELTKFPEVDRAIYGFLCFDSNLTGYFEQKDIDIGYIFGDILSLYLINALNYTEMSESFGAVKNLCKRNSQISKCT